MSIQVLILDAIEQRLTSIVESNGYNDSFLPSTIHRASLKPFKNGDLPAVNFWTGEDTLKDKEYGIDNRQLPVFIEAYTTTRDDNFINTAYTFAADIVQALFRSPAAPLMGDVPDASLGGIIDILEVSKIVPVANELDGAWCGVYIELNVLYKAQLGNFKTFCN